MTKEMWINLPVKDIDKSKKFYTKLGFSLNQGYSSNNMAGIEIGEKKIMLMLFPESVFKTFTKSELTDTKRSTEVLFSFDAESREEVDEMTKKAKLAGGTVFGEPEEIEGWMYGSGFTDLDGHKWNVLYMDMSKMPKG